MAINRITETTAIREGQYVAFEALVASAICGRPCKVLSVSGQRIYIADRHGLPNGYRPRKWAQYVCDTEVEGDLLRRLSDQQAAALADANKRIKAEFAARVAQIVSVEPAEGKPRPATEGSLATDSAAIPCRA